MVSGCFYRLQKIFKNKKNTARLLGLRVLKWRELMRIKNGLITSTFLKIPDNTKYWFVRAGTGARYFRDFKTNNFIAIGDNEVKIEELKKIDSRHQHLKETFEAEYKRVFNTIYLELLENSSEYKELSSSEQSDETEKTKRSSTISATKTYSFIEEMNIGDYVLVPYKRSTAFLIGIIVSNVFDFPLEREYISSQDDYFKADYDKKRSIIWVKEISGEELPDSLSWIQHGHRAVFDISEYAEEINPLISSKYLYKNKAHLRLDVNSEQEINAFDWFKFQEIIVDNYHEYATEIYQKTDVQSPGNIILETIMEHWRILLPLGLSLFTGTDIEVKGVKIKFEGPLARFVPGYKERRLEEQEMHDLRKEKTQEKIKGIELDNESKALDNKIKEYQFNQIKNHPDLIFEESKEENLEKTIRIASDQQQALKNMEITSSEAGRDISIEKQREKFGDFQKD